MNSDQLKNNLDRFGYHNRKSLDSCQFLTLPLNIDNLFKTDICITSSGLILSLVYRALNIYTKFIVYKTSAYHTLSVRVNLTPLKTAFLILFLVLVIFFMLSCQSRYGFKNFSVEIAGILTKLLIRFNSASGKWLFCPLLGLNSYILSRLAAIMNYLRYFQTLCQKYIFKNEIK